MLSSIHPLGERAKGNAYWITATAHVVGATAGGLALGAIAAVAAVAARSLYDAALLWTGAVGCALLAVAAVVDRRLPSWRRQVNEEWLTSYRGWVYGAGFGAQLGTGVVTIVTSPIVYGVVLLAVVVPAPAGSVAIGAVFGFVRGATILSAAGVRTPSALLRLHRRMHALAPAADRAARYGLVLAAVTLAAAGVWA